MAPKKARKNCRDLTTLLVSKELEGEVTRASDWTTVVKLLCHYFKIPDLSTKEGLAECHNDIDRILLTLNTAYDQGTSNLRILGGVVGIWGELVSDPVLRDKLPDQMLIPRISHLLKKDETSLIALQAMKNLAKFATTSAPRDMLQDVLLGVLAVLRKHSDDQSAYQSGIVILARLVALYSGKEPPSPRFICVKMREVLQIMCNGFNKAQFDEAVFGHVHKIILSAALHSYLDLEQNQPALDFIVASFRVPNLKIRSATLKGLLVLYTRHIEETPLAPLIHSETVERLPLHLKNTLDQYGFDRSRTSIELNTDKIADQAIKRAIKTGDCFELGLKLVELIPMIGNSIAVADCSMLRLTGFKNLPFRTTIDAFAAAAKALRNYDSVKYATAADMLDVKFYINVKDYDRAKFLCESAIRRSKDAYWYYSLASFDDRDHEVRLRWARRGLRCESTSSTLYFGLLAVASMAAADLAIKRLESKPLSSDSWYSALALLRASLKDSLEYLESAPPDSSKMPDICVNYVLVSCVLKGSQLSPDMKELQWVQQKLKMADEFSTFLSHGIVQDQYRRSYEIIAMRYDIAVKFWNSRFKFSVESSNGQETSEFRELEDWLPRVIHQNGKLVRTVTGDHEGDFTKDFPPLGDDELSAYMCTYCGTPSASLKKCGQCTAVRYCDAECQKDDWKMHKQHCQPSRA